MEQGMRKPDFRKRAKPPPPKPLPKPKDDPPAPLELGRTQQLIRRIEMNKEEANGSQMQAETGGRPVAPPRAAERGSKITDQSHQAPTDDSKQKVQRPQLGAFHKSRHDKTPASSSNEGPDQSKHGRSVKSPKGKQSSFMETLKGFQIEISVQDSSEEETISEEEQSSDSRNPEKHTEPKPEKGNILSGIFRKTPKEGTSSPSVTVSAPDAERTGEEKASDENLGVAREVSGSSDSLSESNLKAKEKKGIFGGILRKTPKTKDAQDTQSLASELSASNDSLSETAKTTKDKGGLFTGMFKKDAKLAPDSGRPHEDDQSLQGKFSVSSESLSENKEKGNLFSGLLKKTPKAAQRDSQEDLSVQGELSKSNDNLAERKKTQEKGGAFSGMFKKSFKHGEQSQNELSSSSESLPGSTKGNLTGHKELSESNDSLSETKNTKERGKLFTGMFRKSPKPVDATQPNEDEQSLNSDLQSGNESLSETKEIGGLFGVRLKKTPNAHRDTPEEKDSDKTLPASGDGVSETNVLKEKSIFGGMFKKPHKPNQEDSSDKEITMEKEGDKEITASNESLSEGNAAKEKSIFGGIFKKPQRPTQEDRSDREERNHPEEETSTSCENLSEPATQKEKKPGFPGLFKRSGSIDNLDQEDKKPGFPGLFKRSGSNDNLDQEEKGGLFAGLLKKAPKTTRDTAEDRDGNKDITASNDSLSEGNAVKDKSIFGGMFKKPQKATQEDSADREELIQPENEKSASCENLSEATAQKEKKGGLSGLFKRTASIDNLNDNEEKGIFSGIFKKQPKALDGSTSDEDIAGSGDELSETAKEKTGGISAMFKRPPKPVPRAPVVTDPLRNTDELGDSDGENPTVKDTRLEMSASNDSLNEVPTAKERLRAFGGMFRKAPKDDDELRPPAGGSRLKRRKTITKKKRVVSFRVKRTLPRTAKSSDMLPALEEESVEMIEIAPAQEGSVEIQNVEMAAYPAEGIDQDHEESDELMEWWNGVVGWAEWNEAANLEEADEEETVEQAADRLFMAARLFVRIFNQRGASLQKRILELLAQADAADEFHKRTVTAAVGGGVASVAGSVATITGLILAPFTFGASIIVTAVGISVATAGSIASATANITDAVHSNMDRKKVEKMIQGYQDEIKDIGDCLAFVQEGMNTLQDWDFEKYSESAAKKALNHNIKHVIKEGGRAGKGLVVKTNELISTVQVLSAAGGAAKAAQAISVTTGVMSALFLALDVFFLAKDSHELRKGAKTKFAKKIREVCKELQTGLLELNKVKCKLQMTMDGIELEEVEEILEVEEEVEEEESADELESDPVKLAKLYEELDVMEEKLDKKVQDEKELREQEEREKKEREEKERKEKEEKEQMEKEKKEREQMEKEKKEKVQLEKKEKDQKEKEEKQQMEKEKKEKDQKEKEEKQQMEKEKKEKALMEKKEKEQKEQKEKEESKGKEDAKREEDAKSKGKEEAGSGGEQQEKNNKTIMEEVKDSLHSWGQGIKSQSERVQKNQSPQAESRQASQKEPPVTGGKKAKEAENRSRATHGDPGERAEDHGKGKREEKESGRSWLGGLLRGSGEEAKSGPVTDRPAGVRSEEKPAAVPKESVVERHSSRHHSSSSSSSGRSERDRARGQGGEAREAPPPYSRGDAPTASRRTSERGGERAVEGRRGGDPEVRRRESERSQDGVARTQWHCTLDLDAAEGGGRGEGDGGGGSQGVRRGSRTRSERSQGGGAGEGPREGSTREPTRQGSRSRANAVLSDGLNI